MKLIKTILALSVILPATTFASAAQTSNIVLKPVNDNVETQACYIAATNGLDAAKKYIESNDYSFVVFNSALTCNGISIKDFAQKFADKKNALADPLEKSPSNVKLVAVDNNISQLCVDAVILGEKEARVKHDVLHEVVYCNSKTLSRFARTFQNKNVIL
ncbi:hypothetical protein [Glaciecola sp. SC05]|uniref:hypothetical protein n=1 Tax=Glaciecola sp. SC05 TaxID=1987355 RepID=UPI003528787D